MNNEKHKKKMLQTDTLNPKNGIRIPQRLLEHIFEYLVAALISGTG